MYRARTSRRTARSNPIVPATRALVMLAATAAVSVAPASAHAVEFERTQLPIDEQVLLAPSSERVDVAPGTRTFRPFTVTNRTSTTQTFDIVVSDVVRGSDETPYEVIQGQRSAAAAWVRLSDSSVRIPPRTTATMSWNVHVPKAAKPADRLFAISASPRDGPGPRGVQLRYQLTAVMVLQVVGDASDGASVSISGVKPGVHVGGRRHDVTITIRNAGDRVRRPSGEVKLVDRGGDVLWSTGFEQASILPGATLARSYKVPARVSIGQQWIVADLDDAGTNETIRRNAGIVAPAGLVVVLVAAMLVAILLGLRAWRRRREWRLLLEDELHDPAGAAQPDHDR